MSRTHDTAPASVNAQLDALRTEQQQLTDAEVADPLRAAADIPSWHRRNEQRQRRSVEIEHELRDLEEFRSVAVYHPDALRRYLSVARPVEQRYERLIATRSAMHPGDGKDTNAAADIRRWYEELALFARSLPGGSDDARRVLVREAEKWYRLRDAWLVAVATASGRGNVPSPEVAIGGELPGWLRWGAYRIDR